MATCWYYQLCCQQVSSVTYRPGPVRHYVVHINCPVTCFLMLNRNDMSAFTVCVVFFVCLHIILATAIANNSMTTACASTHQLSMHVALDMWPWWSISRRLAPCACCC